MMRCRIAQTVGITLSQVDMLPYDEYLTWEQFVRDAGFENDILMRGFTVLANLSSSKKITAEKMFPFLSPTYGMDLATKIQYTLRQVSEMNRGRQANNSTE